MRIYCAEFTHIKQEGKTSTLVEGHCESYAENVVTFFVYLRSNIVPYSSLFIFYML